MNEQVLVPTALSIKAEWFPLSNYISFVIAALVNATISNPTCLTNLPSVKSGLKKPNTLKDLVVCITVSLFFLLFCCYKQYLIQNINEDKH